MSVSDATLQSRLDEHSKTYEELHHWRHSLHMQLAVVEERLSETAGAMAELDELIEQGI